MGEGEDDRYDVSKLDLKGDLQVDYKGSSEKLNGHIMVFLLYSCTYLYSYSCTYLFFIIKDHELLKLEQYVIG